MTVLVVYDTATSEIRRYDSSKPFGITHEGVFDLEGPLSLREALPMFLDNPPASLSTDAYLAYIRGQDKRPGPWRPDR